MRLSLVKVRTPCPIVSIFGSGTNCGTLLGRGGLRGGIRVFPHWSHRLRHLLQRQPFLLPVDLSQGRAGLVRNRQLPLSRKHRAEILLRRHAGAQQPIPALVQRALFGVRVGFRTGGQLVEEPLHPAIAAVLAAQAQHGGGVTHRLVGRFDYLPARVLDAADLLPCAERW